MPALQQQPQQPQPGDKVRTALQSTPALLLLCPPLTAAGLRASEQGGVVDVTGETDEERRQRRRKEKKRKR